MDEHAGLRYLYFDVAHAIETQRWVIENSGGLPGVKNVEQLQRVLGHIHNDIYYPEMSDKLCHLVFSINKNHPFNDGNKRSSIALGAYFLELNGYDYVVKRFVLEMENIAVYVADNVVDRELLRELITPLLYGDDYSESIKLALIEAISQSQADTDFE